MYLLFAIALYRANGSALTADMLAFEQVPDPFEDGTCPLVILAMLNEPEAAGWVSHTFQLTKVLNSTEDAQAKPFPLQCDPKWRRAGIWQPFVNHATSPLQVNNNKVHRTGGRHGHYPFPMSSDRKRCLDRY
jgi:hypothetical protein